MRTYLERFGVVEAEQYEEGPEWHVQSGEMFRVCILPPDPQWTVDLFSVGEDEDVLCSSHDTLPEAMQWAVERWRELVAKSDPMPPEKLR